MTCLLVAVNARYSHSCLAQYAIKKACKEQKIPVMTQQWSINKPLEETREEILAVKPELIAFSCYIWNSQYIISLATMLKEKAPQLTIVLGGPEAEGQARNLLTEYPMIDFVLCGEGEYVFPLFYQAWAKGMDYVQVPGLYYRQQGVIKNNIAAPLLLMDDLPFPYEEENLQDFAHHILYYESSRGCPFTCSYCSSAGQKPRLRSMDFVKEDLKQILHSNARTVKFVDRTFNWPVDRACEIITFLLQHYRPGICFHMEMAPDLLDEKMLALLSTAPKGFLQIEAGIQSTCPAALKAVRRHMDWPKICQAMQYLLQNSQVHLHLDLIAGLPEESYAQFADSFRDVYALGAHHLQLGFLKVLPGSILAQEAQQRGLVYSDVPPYQIIETPSISNAELQKLEWIADILDLYYNSERFYDILAFAIEQYGDSFAFYESFADFTKNRLQKNAQLKVKYEYLYHFLIAIWPQQKETWRYRLAKNWQNTVKSAKIPFFLQYCNDEEKSFPF